VPPQPKLPQDPEMEAIVKRLNEHVASVPRRYPEAWKQVDRFRQDRGRNLPDWPAWCFLPLAGGYAIATGGQDDVAVTNSDVSAITGLAAWRVTKGIYRFDPTVFEELWGTPVTGDIPTEVLERLPEWCCYIPFLSPRSVMSDLPDCHGFFVYLEHDQTDGHRELRFLLDYEPLHLTGLAVHLSGTLSEGISAMIDESLRQAKLHKQELPENAIRYLRETMPDSLSGMVSLTLYLCSTTAEIIPRKGIRPNLRHAKRGSAIFAAQEPVVWDVAYRIGRTLRAAEVKPTRDQGGTHASPRAHIRRAHWHSFWTGEKAKVGVARETNRQLVLRWLPPTPVNADDDEPIPTVHRVTKLNDKSKK
jgi:hypothetical protein